VIEVEYDVDPKNYEGCSTTEEMLKIDLTNANEDPFLFIDSLEAKWDITGEIVDNQSTKKKKEKP
jgi:hypothetical protein